MKRILSLLALAVLGTCVSINAQSIFDSADNDSGFGVRVGWDYNIPSTNFSGFDSGSGFSAGAIYDIPLYMNLYFEPGLSIFYNTMSVDYFDIMFDGKPVGPSGTIQNWGFRIPMIFGYRFDLVDDISVSVITGPQLNVGLSNKMHYRDAKSSIDLYDMYWRRLDAQWVFGMKFHYLDNLFAEITGGVGLTNMLNGNHYKDSHFRRNIVNISVGYLF